MLKKSIIPPGYFGDSVSNIVIIDNFVTNEDLLRIRKLANSVSIFESIPNDNWDNRVANTNILDSNYAELGEILKIYTNKLKIEIERYFDMTLGDRVPSLVIWREGDVQPPHADKQEIDGSPNNYPENDIASLIYINDDYEGGEIYFEKQGIFIKPIAGQAVFFPGDINYLHGVTEVTKGIRFTCPNFWTVTKNNKTNEENT